MASVGIDRETGKPLTGLQHVVQSMYVIISTKFGARFRRRAFGSDIPPLLGKNIVPSTFLRFVAAFIVACELWEPRVRIVQVTFPGSSNSPDRIRAGQIGLAVLGQYLPNGHLGDPTPEGPASLLLL